MAPEPSESEPDGMQATDEDEDDEDDVVIVEHVEDPAEDAEAELGMSHSPKTFHVINIKQRG